VHGEGQLRPVSHTSGRTEGVQRALLGVEDLSYCGRHLRGVSIGIHVFAQ
jgi:hypothetical protein